MTEQLKSHGEHKQNNLDLSVEIKNNSERLRTDAENAQEKDRKSIEKLHTAAKAEAVSGKDVVVDETAESGQQKTSHLSQRTLKEQAYRQGLSKIRHHLPANQRTFSKIIHQPVVNTVSEVGSKTIGRTSGLLFAGIFTLVGSTFVLFAARHYGFSYNFGIFIALFVGGYLLGILVELVLGLLRKKS
jgi:hypothetical protein